MSVEDLTDLVKNTVEDRLIAAPGVADLQIYGGRERIFRVDVDQIALASRGLTLADVGDALATVAFDSPAGSLTASNQSLVVRTTATVCGSVPASRSSTRPVLVERRATVIASATAVASSSRLAPAVGSPVRSLTIVWKFSSASSRPWLISGW